MVSKPFNATAPIMVLSVTDNHGVRYFFRKTCNTTDRSRTVNGLLFLQTSANQNVKECTVLAFGTQFNNYNFGNLKIYSRIISTGNEIY